MKITRLAAWRVDLPFRDGSYSWSGGSIDGFVTTVVAIETADGVTIKIARVGGVTRAHRPRPRRRAAPRRSRCTLPR